MQTEGYVPKYGHYEILDFIWQIIYEHTINRYPREWSTYFYTLLMENNELHWCLLILLVKTHFKLSIFYSSMGKIYCNIKYSLLTATNLSGPSIFAQDTSSEIHQYN